MNKAKELIKKMVENDQPNSFDMAGFNDCTQLIRFAADHLDEAAKSGNIKEIYFRSASLIVQLSMLLEITMGDKDYWSNSSLTKALSNLKHEIEKMPSL